MELNTAIRLIEKGIETQKTPQVWADLGAGNGLFTQALATLLPPGSKVYAVDRDATALNRIELASQAVGLVKVQKDFVRDDVRPEPFDGVLMANALHFVADKKLFLKNVTRMLKPVGRLVLVEYDMNTANAWVPYPISHQALILLGGQCGFTTVVKLEEEPSVYNRATMYSAMLLC